MTLYQHTCSVNEKGGFTFDASVLGKPVTVELQVPANTMSSMHWQP